MKINYTLSIYFSLLLFLVFFLNSNLLQAQQDKNRDIIQSSLIGLEYRVKAGLNIGGTSPLPLPAEIRQINEYNPTLSLSIEGDVLKWLDSYWGIMLGVRLENRGMKTDAKVKNYYMEMVSEDGHMRGAWTGNVKTKVHNSYFSIPLLAVYKLSPRWEVKVGPVFSWLINGGFSGEAYDGYIRDINPTGVKTQVSYATYEFSDELQTFQWGAQFGGEWRAFSYLNIFADFNWGISPIFPDTFQSVTFDMYPLYLNIGFSYIF